MSVPWIPNMQLQLKSTLPSEKTIYLTYWKKITTNDMIYLS